MADGLYTSLTEDIANNNVDFGADTFYVLLTSGYTPDQDADTKRSNVTNEITGVGYSSGGIAAPVSSVTKDTGNNRTRITFALAEWTGATISATYAVYYKRRGGAATADELVGWNDFGGTYSVTNGTFRIPASTLDITLA
jgi:hypothetical protein